MQNKIVLSIVYLLYLYITYLYTSELILEFKKIVLPHFKSLVTLNQILLLCGGIVVGIILLRYDRIHKIFGWLAILMNIIITGFLLSKAII